MDMEHTPLAASLKAASKLAEESGGKPPHSRKRRALYWRDAPPGGNREETDLDN